MERVAAVHLAAEAPMLRFELERLARRMERMLGQSGQWRRDEQLLQGAWGAVIASKPPYEVVAEILRQKGQTEIEFEESA